ncbi:MAG: hypothetical protein WD876_03385 [Candidatus Pacearchaeota archaeon]
MQTEMVRYIIKGPINFNLLDEMRKLAGIDENVIYPGDIRDNGDVRGVFHMQDNTLLIEARNAYMIGQLINRNRTRKDLEKKLNITLKPTKH